MPLEFLLSTHIATMTPDLSYKLATEFNTDVEILLWKSKNNSLEGGVQQESGEIVTYKQLDEVFRNSLSFNIIDLLNGDIIYRKKATARVFAQYSINSLIGEENEEGSYFCTNGDCSRKARAGEIDETCDNCADFVSLLYLALNAINDKKFDTYVPYLNSITDHWFRNVYFTYGGMKQYIADMKGKEVNNVSDSEIPNVIVTDEDYYLSTGEMWTQYEMSADGSDYELYVYLPDASGNYSGEFAENGTLICREGGPYSISEKAGNLYDKKGNGGYGLYIVSGSGENKSYTGYNGNVEEFRVGKKAIIDRKEEGWNVYNLDAERTGEDEWVLYESDEEDENKYIKEAKGLKGVQLMYNLITVNGKITQKEDGVRGETNAKTKKLFLDDYYLYDGSGPRAALIEEAKTKANSNDPDSFRQKFGTAEITATYKDKPYTATIDDISGPINILQNSLTAFSILRNMHTLDAEYIYHDFKELIVELDYFDKEELIESEREVMIFPISGLSSAGWPVTRYDKSEEFYGTLLHSAKDYETKRQQTIEELAELFGEEIEEGEEAEQNPVQPNPDAVTSDNLLVKAAADIMSYMQDNDYAYCQGPGYHPRTDSSRTFYNGGSSPFRT